MRAQGNSIPTRPPTKRVKSLIGCRYGRLVVRAHVGITAGRYRNSIWECACDCGRKIHVRGQSLKGGRTLSCGCYFRDQSHDPRPERRTHGETGTKLYFIWRNIIERCENPNAQAYQNYGGRGIRIDPEWRKDYAKFRDDIGPRPSPDHSLDRIDNNQGYAPGNMRWATRDEQQRNTRKYCFSCRALHQQPPIPDMTDDALDAEIQRVDVWVSDLIQRRVRLRAERARRVSVERTG